MSVQMRSWAALALGCAVVMSSCSDPDENGPAVLADVAQEGGGETTQPKKDTGATDAAETTTDEDAGTGDVTTLDVGPIGEDALAHAPDFNAPCEKNENCSTGFCIEGPDGKVCTETCINNCPSEWTCEGVTNFGGDITYICVPKYSKLCSPCSVDAECAGDGARCLELKDEGNYCSRKCSGDAPCPDGFVCKPQDDLNNLCVPSTGSCICTKDLLGTKKNCFKESTYGICYGNQTCAGPGGWSACDAKSPAAEVCDGWDNDCDGAVDEQLGGAPCEKSNDVGTCKGAISCSGVAGLVCTALEATVEACDGKDNDCDGLTDEVDAEGCTVLFEDKDKDGFGNAISAQCLCKATQDYTATEGNDCNDLNPNAAPGKTEICNGLDEDCDGLPDGEDSIGCVDYFKDGDGDGYGNDADGKCLCSPKGAWKALVSGDCDDSTAAIYPGAAEKCNTVDDNCNGVVDEAGSVWCQPFMKDGDGDGYGVTGLQQCLCGPFEAWKATKGGDCDDGNAELNPIAFEVCDGKDNNCNGLVDEDCDKDNDGYCNGLKPIVGKPATCPLGGGDCIDWDPLTHPNAAEICDGVDNNCDGEVDENVTSPCGGCDPVCLWDIGPKSDEPFTEGDSQMDGAGTDKDGNIVLDSSSISLNMIWISNSGQGTVSKLNTDTGNEVGRYKICGDPSRTAVDADGNVWVACRGDGYVGKIALAESDCVDKNNNGTIETSRDTNGNKVIDGDEMLPQGQDECVLFTVQPDGANVARAMGVDKDNNGWVGLWNTKRLWKIDKINGKSLKSIQIPANPYGLAIAQDGIIWVAGRGGSMLVKVNPDSGAVNTYQSNVSPTDPYGITIDENGRIWYGNCCGSHVAVRFDPVTATWATAAVSNRPRGMAADGKGFIYVANDESSRVAKVDINTMQTVAYAELGAGRFPVGVAVDFDGKVWAVNQQSSTATRIDPTDNKMTIMLEAPTGPSPYTYSDMTGYAQKTIVAPKGTYLHTFEGWKTGKTQWMQVGLNIVTPEGTSAQVRVRAAETKALLAEASWTPSFGPFPPEVPPVNLSKFGAVIGRYLDVEVTLFSGSNKVTPILKKVDVVAAAYTK